VAASATARAGKNKNPRLTGDFCFYPERSRGIYSAVSQTAKTPAFAGVFDLKKTYVNQQLLINIGFLMVRPTLTFYGKQGFVVSKTE
jgi:hypothetical protein